MGARAIPVVLTEEDHKFKLDEEALKEVLLHPRVRDKKVVVVSVAGAFRKGKSFLLNFFLRYFHAKGASDWLGDLDSRLTGFSWKGGSERHTSGILLWSEPFEVTLPNNEEVCVLLMDTQGQFDSDSTVKDCATVFALSTMISSIQIYNLSGNIQENDLQHLELFTDYGRLAMEENRKNKTKPFQHLQFLVRDWQCPYEYNFGSDGGDKLLKKRLKIVDRQHEELAHPRKLLGDCFDHIGCFLMPHPGMDVATNKTFDGRLGDIDEKFRVHVKEFVSTLLCPKNLEVKTIDGSMLTGGDLMHYFESWVKVFQGNELPTPKSMWQATADANNLVAADEAENFYAEEMKKACKEFLSYIDPMILHIEHQRCLKETLERFNAIRKMGGEEYSHQYAVKLKKKIESIFLDLVKQNDAKNVFFRVCVKVCTWSIVGIMMPSVLGMSLWDAIGRNSHFNVSVSEIYQWAHEESASAMRRLKNWFSKKSFYKTKSKIN